MIKIKTQEEIQKMRKAGKHAAKLMNYIAPFVKEGVSTLYLNDLCEQYTQKMGAVSAPLNYNGFPKSICTSVNDVICHGIPSKNEILKDGDIVNIDITIILNGFHADMSRTFMIGNVKEDAQLLVQRTEKSLHKAINAVKPGKLLSIVGKTIEDYINKFGYSIVRDYTGHGIGKFFHEDPEVLHYFCPGNTIRIRPGMIFTIEPMINLGNSFRTVLSKEDNWTVRTEDGSLSAQFEHTILVTEKGAEILTE